MGVSTKQQERVLSDVAQILYQRGVAPTTDTILKIVSDFFSQYPVGAPLPIPYATIADGARSDVTNINTCISNTLFNLEILYEACMDQVEDILQLNQTLRRRLSHLNTKRQILSGQVQDYLLGQFNTDGYFMSVSDSFVDVGSTDLLLTNAFVDTTAHHVSIPAISNQTVQIDPSNIKLTGFKVTVNDAKPVPPVKVSVVHPIDAALDNLANTAWQVDVTSNSKDPATLIANFSLNVASTAPVITRMEYTPYGITPNQVFFASGTTSAQPPTTVYTNFGGQIAQTSGQKVVFVDTPRNVGILQMVLRKDTPDYIDQTTGKTQYHYIFGASSIAFYRYYYDDFATFVSAPLSMPDDLTKDMVIDAVSVVVEDNIPDDTTISYFVADDPDPSEQHALDDFQWRPILPLSEVPDANNIVHFDGAELFSVFIRDTPESSSDLQLIAPDTTNSDPTLLNPTPSVIPGVDVYRIAAFNEDVLLSTLTLDEGINSTRIYYTDYDIDAVKSLDFWQPLVVNNQVNSTYARIDASHDFFYAGINPSVTGQSFYIETYLEVVDTIDTVIGEIRKNDPNSQQWDVRVLQNGRDIGYLPAGVNTAQIPWKFNTGLNHIGVLVNVPPATATYPNPWVGTLNLIGSQPLYNYGTVKLGTWTYVDFYNMQYNQTGNPSTFTIFDGEIISRKQPSLNFRLGYNKVTGTGPQAIRFRADLSRTQENPSLSPFLSSYRLRFAYGNNN